MRTSCSHIVITLLLLFSSWKQQAIAQMDSLQVEIGAVDQEIVLPSIDTAIAMAVRNSPLVQNQLLVIEQKKIKYDIDKKLILRALTINSQYSYGNNSAVINNQLMNVPYSSATATNFYSGGVFLNISVFQITARKKQLEMSKLDIKMAEDQLRQMKRSIEQEVKQHYIELVKQKNILNLRLEAVSSAQMAKEFAEREFRSGTKSMEALSNANEAFTKLSIALQQSHAAYIAALYNFETLIGK